MMTGPLDNDLPLLEHLESLRKLLFRILLAMLLLFPLGFYFAENCIELLLATACPPEFSLHYFSPLEPFIVKIKIAAFISLMVLSPYIGLQIWTFVAPGLHRHERSFLLKLALSSWALFIVGVLFCARFIIPALMRFSLSMQTSFLTPIIGIGSFVGMSALLILGFGVMFQFPIAVFLLVRSGIVSVAALKRKRPLILIIVLALSAILTPPDVISQLLMALPTYLLFELSLFFSGFGPRPEKTDPGTDEFSVEETADSEVFERNADSPPGKEYSRTKKTRRIHAIGYRKRRK